MHKTTFNTLDRNGFAGTVVTAWQENAEHWGKRGVIANIIQPRTVTINFDDGTRANVDHRKVALGDNSGFANDC